jgi:hypothetical protein
MDPMQQFFQNQLQLLENLTSTVANLQAQVNNPPQPPPPQQPAPMNKHREFMSHRPPVFTHAADPLDADDWLNTVSKMLTTAQCDDRRRSYSLQDDFRGQQEHGGMLILPPMLRPTLLPGRSSLRVSGVTTFLQG